MSSSPPQAESDFNTHFENRNSEATHKQKLAEALDYHERIRAGALRALKRESRRIQAEQRKSALEGEEQDIKLATLEAEQKMKALELEAKRRAIPKPPARLPTPPPPPQPAPAPPSASQSSSSQPPASQPSTTQLKAPAQPSPAHTQTQVQTPQVAKVIPQSTTPALPPPTIQPQTTPTPSTNQQTAGPTQKPNPFQTQQAQPQNNVAPQINTGKAVSGPADENQWAKPLAPHPYADRYVVIHKRLKELRKFIDDECERNKAFRVATGELRRGIRQAVGQLVASDEPGANMDPIRKVTNILLKALANQGDYQSPLIDPSEFVAGTLEPVEGAKHNGSLPSLLIYLLNHFSKALLSQFINEAGVKPETAKPIGFITVHIFSNFDFLWRGKTLIDIMMSKYRVVCPVLFGIRGNEATKEGRARVGWWRHPNGQFVEEQHHNNRMAGLGVGWAAICLRKFKSARKHPWPTNNYWISMANMINTPKSEICSTQYMVLRAMLDHHAPAFLEIYGNAAIAGMQVATIHFPARAPVQSAASRSLAVLADQWKKDLGLDLTDDAFRQ